MVQHNNLENRMGIFSRKKQTIGEKDPEGRRDFLKKTGIAAASLWLGNSIFNSDIAHARKEVPGAIIADPDPAITYAWNIFHNKIWVNEPKQWSGKDRALMILRFTRDNTGWGATDGLIHPDTPKSSHAYWLLATQMGAVSDIVVKDRINSNPGLREFAFGLQHLYSKENVWARERFANGIFVSANLDPNDYQRLQSVGIPIHYRTDLNQEANAKNLAKNFVETNLVNKEKILNVAIGEKFRNTTGDFATTDINTPQYALKNTYWNLGFYINTEYRLKNDIAKKLDRIPNNKTTYALLHKVFKYDSMNGNLT